MMNHHEATHINSSEGEKVPFKAAVRLEGPVEVCIPVHLCTCMYICLATKGLYLEAEVVEEVMGWLG